MESDVQKKPGVASTHHTATIKLFLRGGGFFGQSSDVYATLLANFVKKKTTARAYLQTDSSTS